MAALETSPVLRIVDARCTIGRRRIFAALSMEVRAGERVHLAGPNGSGKTTALRCIGGTMSIDHGRIDIDGAPAGSGSARISTGLCVNPEQGLFPRLSGHDNLLFAARLRIPAGQVVGAVAAVEREMAIARFAGQPTRNYSAGMRARVTVARALLGRPTLLLMDEPTRSLDAEGRDLFWAAVDRRPETACLIASHLPADRDRCDYSVDLRHCPDERACVRINVTHRRLDTAERGRTMSAFDGAPSRFGLTARASAGRQSLRTRTSGDVNTGATLTAFLRRDLAESNLLRAGLVLDLGYGLVNLLIFQFISRVLHHPGGEALGGSSSYFDFVAVGLAYLLVVQAACAQLTNRVRDQQRDGTLEVTVAAPVSPGTIALGLAGYPMLLGTLRCVIYLTAAAVLLGLDVSSTDWSGLVVMVLLGALAALGIGICLAAIAVAFSHGDAVGRAAVVTLGLLSGAYFPISAMPAPMRWAAQVLPTRMAIEGLRAAMAGGGWLPTALLLATTSAVLVPAAIWLFARGLRRARSTGTLVRG